MNLDRDPKTLLRIARVFIGKSISNNAKYLWSALLSLLSGYVTLVAYFDDNPLFGIPLLGTFTVVVTVFLFVFFLGNRIIHTVGLWFESLFVKVLNRALVEFWNSQTKRFATVIKRDGQQEMPKSSSDSINIVSDSVVLDTSCLIDYRIVGVIRSGFLDRNIIVTQNVLDELQYFADKDDSVRRRKGRRGLDAVKEIKRIVGRNKFNLIKLKTPLEKVDESLVSLCRKNKSKLATVDFNLNKVAQATGVHVLNVNRLANEMKTNAVPGEILEINLRQKGKEKKQAIGYLDDGTMVVVKDAVSFLGENKQVKVEKVLQTDAGRMIFGLIWSDDSSVVEE